MNVEADPVRVQKRTIFDILELKKDLVLGNHFYFSKSLIDGKLCKIWKYSFIENVPFRKAVYFGPFFIYFPSKFLNIKTFSI